LGFFLGVAEPSRGAGVYLQLSALSSNATATPPNIPWVNNEGTGKEVMWCGW